MRATSRKEREYRQRRQEILAAAEKRFALKGFHTTTMAEVAKESEFAIGTLYQFFKNKEDLYTTVLGERFDGLLDVVKREAEAPESCEKRIRSIVTTIVSFIEDNADFFRILLREWNSHGDTTNDKPMEVLIAKHFTYLELFATVIEEGRVQGLFRDCAPRDMALVLAGMINIFTLDWLLEGQAYPLSSKIGVLMEVFLHGSYRSQVRFPA